MLWLASPFSADSLKMQVSMAKRRTTSRVPAIAGAIAAACATVSLAATDQYTQTNTRPNFQTSQTLRPLGSPGFSSTLQTVDPRHDDVGPLALSLRDLQPDLRQPTGFEKVYRIGQRSPNGDDRFARVSGALAAVFSRSEYTRVQRRNGGSAIRVDVPAGTIYYIGGIPAQRNWGFNADPDAVRASASSAGIDSRADTAASTRVAPLPPQTTATAAAPQRTPAQTASPLGSTAPGTSASGARNSTAKAKPLANQPVGTSSASPAGNRSEATQTQRPSTITDRPGIMNNETFRAERVRSLLQTAANTK